MPPADNAPLILLVDDERDLLAAFSAQLGDTFRIEMANSAAEADIILGLQPVDLIITDHLMPGENGLDFRMRVQEHFPATKRILVTGYMNPDLITRATALAVLSAFLVKPVNRAQLLGAVQTALSLEG
jgi:DNA-binding NtrC family response regulator